MKKYFQCPDKELTLISKCYEKCRLGNRCAPVTYLRACARERKWSGKPSVTQLIKGTREAYLTITEDYAVTPQKEAFNILGTGVHKELEEYAKDTNTEAEVLLELNGITGMADLIEDGILYDFKTAGSFKIAKALGMTVISEKDVPNGRFKKDGTPMTRKEKIFAPVKDNRDILDWELQFNMYKIMARENGYSVKNCYAFGIVRDGGLYIAFNRGVMENFYLIDADEMDDNFILNYFDEKKNALLYALEHRTMPAICNETETWNGNKCDKWCAVRDVCRKYEEEQANERTT